MTALDEQHGITSASRAPAMLDRRILAHARKVVGLCDSSKLGLHANALVGPVEMLDVLVTDVNVSAICGMLREHGVEVVLASRDGVLSGSWRSLTPFPEYLVAKGPARRAGPVVHQLNFTLS